MLTKVYKVYQKVRSHLRQLMPIAVVKANGLDQVSEVEVVRQLTEAGAHHIQYVEQANLVVAHADLCQPNLALASTMDALNQAGLDVLILSDESEDNGDGYDDSLLVVLM